MENEWAKNKHTPGAMPCMRCGGPMRKSLAENALSRALNVYVCPACGMDEALRDAAGKVRPISEWYAVKQHRFAEHKKPQAIKLTPACAFTEIFSGARKTLPLSGARYPASLVAYSRREILSTFIACHFSVQASSISSPHRPLRYCSLNVIPGSSFIFCSLRRSASCQSSMPL